MTKADLLAQIDAQRIALATLLPDNTSEAITPAHVRQAVGDTLDRLYDAVEGIQVWEENP